MTLTIVKPGLQTSIQAGPRRGLRHQGIPANGAADPLSLALANRLVGNAWNAAAIEATLLGPTLRFSELCTFAMVGAPLRATLDGAAVALHETVTAIPGEVLEMDSMEAGARTYLAVAGGLDITEVLGSASTNLQAGFGGYNGRQLLAGDELGFCGRSVEHCSTPEEFRAPMSSSWGLRTCESSETGLLSDEARELLFSSNWCVDRRADRMGLRLDGVTLEIQSDGRMPSAAVFPGTIQCPEDGAPYILSVDAGTVGGYPRVAEVARLDRHLLGQLRPGDRARLLSRDPDDALEELRAKHEYWRPWLEDIEGII
ncbi:MAG: biotin-dependent carboxyltransferase family protein [Gammaproteobacteria bacterium]|nr:biotin-dependent carboxyltransferase family protein [Gammaproteobacteria bacterium]